MNKASLITSQDQATGVRCIIQVFFNHLTCLQHISNFFCADLSLKHPLDGMKTVGDLFVTHSQTIINLAVVSFHKSFSLQEALNGCFMVLRLEGLS